MGSLQLTDHCENSIKKGHDITGTFSAFIRLGVCILPIIAINPGCAGREVKPSYPPQELHALLNDLNRKMGDREKTPEAVRKEVLAQLDEILIDQPSCYAARLLRSELSVLRGETQQGLEDLATLEKLYGAAPPLKALEGLAWYRSGDKEKADRAFRAALKLNRRNVRALLYSGIILAEDGQLDEAGKYFRRVLKIDPDNKTALKYHRTVRAQENSEAGRELAGATDTGHVKQSGLLLLKAGKLRPAVPLLLEALRASPRDRELLMAASRAFARLSDYLNAAGLLHQLIESNGRDTEAWHLLGIVYAKAGENDDRYLHHALHCYQKAVSLDPERFDALHAAAKTACLLGDLERALSLYRTALEKEPDDPAFYIDYGLFTASMGSYDAAVSLYLKGLEKAPGDTDLLAHLMAAYFETGRFERARALQKQLAGASAVSPAARSLCLFYSGGKKPE